MPTVREDEEITDGLSDEEEAFYDYEHDKSDEFSISSLSKESYEEPSSIEEQIIPYPVSTFYLLLALCFTSAQWYTEVELMKMYCIEELKLEWASFRILYKVSQIANCLFAIPYAMLVESYLGRYTGIMICLITRLFAQCCMNVTLGLYDMTLRRWMYIGAWIVMGITTNSYRSLIIVLGAEQFVLPQHSDYLSTFFVMVVFMMHTGGFLAGFSSNLTTGREENFLLDFTIDALLVLIAIVIMAGARKKLHHKSFKGKRTGKYLCCTLYLVGNMMMCRRKRKFGAKTLYSERFQVKTKSFLWLIVLVIPMFAFHIFSEQVHIWWHEQAASMDADLGFMAFVPEYMWTFIHLTFIILVPLISVYVFPKRFLRTKLRRLIFGWLIVIVTCCLGALTVWYLELNEPPRIPKDTYRTYVFNPSNCMFTLNISKEKVVVPPFDYMKYKMANTDGPAVLKFKAGMVTDCPHYPNEVEFSLVKGKLTVHGIYNEDIYSYVEEFANDRNGEAQVRVIADSHPRFTKDINLIKNDGTIFKHEMKTIHKVTKVPPGQYSIENISRMYELGQGGIYLFLMYMDSRTIHSIMGFTIRPASTVNVVLLLPQIILAEAAEMIMRVETLDLLFRDAPTRMRCAVLAAFYLPLGIGQFIALLLGSGKIDQTLQYLLCAGLNAICLFAFIVLAERYRYRMPLLPKSRR